MNQKHPSERAFTVPNLLTEARIVGSPLLILLASFRLLLPLCVLVAILVFTEWADGFLARRMHLSSALGARLDSIADAVFYSCLLIAVAVLEPEVVRSEATWILIAIASYALSWLASLLRFRKLPSYHTWGAKGVWVLVIAGIVALLLQWSTIPFRVAMVCVAIANAEAFLITWVLPDCRVDVHSFRQALRIRASRATGEQG